MKINHDPAKQIMTVLVDGGLARLSYRLGSGGTMDIYSTFVPEEARGKKVAELLVREAIAFAKTKNLKIIPSCPYVDRWFEAHPEEQGVLSG